MRCSKACSNHSNNNKRSRRTNKDGIATSIAGVWTALLYFYTSCKIGVGNMCLSWVFQEMRTISGYSGLVKTIIVRHKQSSRKSVIDRRLALDTFL